MTSPTGSMGLAQQHLANMIADSAAFRAWVGAADQAEAFGSIYQDALPPGGTDLADLQALRPFALVWTDPQLGFNKQFAAGGAARWHTASGVIGVYFEAEIDAADASDPAEAGVKFKNVIDAIQSEMDAINGQAGYLGYDEIRKVEGPTRSDEDDRPTQGDFLFLVWQVVWKGV